MTARPVRVPRAMKPFRSHRVALRGLDTHVLTWGDPAAPKLFLLHGWMDVAASFQFLVDAFAREWHVIAPDLRGYGKSAWQPQGYWYADYIADLEALLQAFAPGEAVNLAGHSLGGNVVLHYAGVRPERARTVDLARRVRHSRRGLGRRRRPRSRNGWTRSRRRRNSPPMRASTRSPAGCRRTIRGCRATRRCSLPRTGPRRSPDGRVRLASDPRHKLPFPSVYRIEETYAVWRNITAPTLWVAAAESNIPKWLDDHPEGEGATDSFAGIRRRFAHIPHGRMVTIADAGHMLHHDQPAAVAAAMEAFLARG